MDEERRRSALNDNDHDLLIEINANLKNLMLNHTIHLQDDSKQFGEINNMIKTFQRDRWVGYGIVVAIVTGIRFFFKV